MDTPRSKSFSLGQYYSVLPVRIAAATRTDLASHFSSLPDRIYGSCVEIKDDHVILEIIHPSARGYLLPVKKGSLKTEPSLPEELRELLDAEVDAEIVDSDPSGADQSFSNLSTPPCTPPSTPPRQKSSSLQTAASFLPASDPLKSDEPPQPAPTPDSPTTPSPPPPHRSGSQSFNVKTILLVLFIGLLYAGFVQLTPPISSSPSSSPFPTSSESHNSGFVCHPSAHPLQSTALASLRLSDALLPLLSAFPSQNTLTPKVLTFASHDPNQLSTVLAGYFAAVFPGQPACVLTLSWSDPQELRQQIAHKLAEEPLALIHLSFGGIASEQETFLKGLLDANQPGVIKRPDDFSPSFVVSTLLANPVHSFKEFTQALQLSGTDATTLLSNVVLIQSNQHNEIELVKLLDNHDFSN